MKIFNVFCWSFGRGGAEKNLLKFLKSSEREGQISIWVSKEASLGRNTPSFSVARSQDALRFGVAGFFKLILIDRNDGDIVNIGWMYRGCITASICWLFIGGKLVWVIRHSDFSSDKLKTKILVRVLGLVSSFVDPVLVFNSYAGLRSHSINMRFRSPMKSYVTSNFVPAMAAPSSVDYSRIPDVYWVGRPHRQKNLGLLAEIILRANESMNRQSFQIFGVECDQLLAHSHESEQLCKLIARGIIHCRGYHENPLDKINHGLVISTSISGEGVSNVLLEGICFAHFCLATDCGDSSLLLPPRQICNHSNQNEKADWFVRHIFGYRDLQATERGKLLVEQQKFLKNSLKKYYPVGLLDILNKVRTEDD